MAEDLIRDALRLMPYGFYSITSRSGDERNIMVANWLTQISFEPRLLALGLQKTAYTHELVEAGRVFAVNLFKKEYAEAIKRFSKSRKRNPDKIKGARFDDGPETGCPILKEADAYLECRVRVIVDAGGDHDVVIAEIVGGGVRNPGEPSEILTLPDLGWDYAG